MDKFDAMRVFIRIVERRSFTLAAEDLGMPRSSATDAIRQLETYLGVRLLQRTTRVVSPTLDGDAYYQRCVSLLAELEETEAAFRGASPKGLIRVSTQGAFARHFLLPRLPDFMASYPDLQVFLKEGDRLVDLVREGIDCVIRAGEQKDSSMIARTLGLLREVTCASPAYLERHGVPVSPDRLEDHLMIGFFSSATGSLFPLEFSVDGSIRQVLLPARISVADAETNLALARLGFGLIQVPHYHVVEDLAAGRLVEVLADYPPSPTPMSLLYPQNRQLSSRVRVFMDWVVDVLEAAGHSQSLRQGQP